MKQFGLIIFAFILIAFSSSALSEPGKIVFAGNPTELKTYQVELEVESILEKSKSDFAPCFPPVSTEVGVYKEVMKDPKVVQVLKFEYLDWQKSLEGCPDRAVLNARIRYLSK